MALCILRPRNAFGDIGKIVAAILTAVRENPFCGTVEQIEEHGRQDGDAGQHHEEAHVIEPAPQPTDLAGRVRSDYAAKGYTIWDSLTRGRSDGALVRLITPIAGT